MKRSILQTAFFAWLYLKLALKDNDGKWLTNINTEKYDTAKWGTWPKFDAWIETTPQTARSTLAIAPTNYATS